MPYLVKDEEEFEPIQYEADHKTCVNQPQAVTRMYSASHQGAPP